MSGWLPLHIATEHGAGEALLCLLVEAYPDGCYRMNKDGDLPIHLLLKSSAAKMTSVELLLRPTMQNKSICRIGRSKGMNLLLHIAAEYQCSFQVLEKLLQMYGEAAMRHCTTATPTTCTNTEQQAVAAANDDGDDDSSSAYALYALDIFEQGQAKAGLLSS